MSVSCYKQDMQCKACWHQWTHSPMLNCCHRVRVRKQLLGFIHLRLNSFRRILSSNAFLRSVTEAVTQCSSWLTVQALLLLLVLLLVVLGQTTHNTLVYLTRPLHCEPLADCTSPGLLAGARLRVFPVRAPSKASSRGFPRRAACDAWDGPPRPSPPPAPALTDAAVLMPPAVMVGESLVSGSAVPGFNFFPPLSRHVSPPHATIALLL